MSPILKGHAAIYTDLYELTMAQGYFLTGRHQQPACFDYFFRKLPFNGGYVVFAGLQDLLEILEDLRFSPDDIQYLKSLGFNKEFLSFLEKFQFKGSLYCVREGEIVFPNELLLRVEGNMLEAQIIETLLLNILNFESLIATKASRVKLAAGARGFVDFGLRRAQGLGGIHASRASIIGGADATSNVFSALMFGLKTSGTMAHSWVQSFENELEAFRSFAQIYPTSSVFLVDTYNTINSGVPNAITVAHEMEKSGHQLLGIRLDSGDLAYLSKMARAMLDKAGLAYVKIVASNQLDEYIIKSLLDQGACIDMFGVGTSLVVGRDDGALDGVYKLSMCNNEARLKISDNIEKVLLPGIKKVFRYFDSENKFYADAIVPQNEDEINEMIHPYQPTKRLDLRQFRKEVLLNCVMNSGRIVIEKQTPYQIANYARERLALLPSEHKRFENPHIYKVGISAGLMKYRDQLVNSKSVP